MAIHWIDVENDALREVERPSDYECLCKNRNPDDHLLDITEGTATISHTVCGKQIDDDGYIEIWNTVESIPVRVEFEDFGWTPSTPNGPAEYEGFQYTIKPRKE